MNRNKARRINKIKKENNHCWHEVVYVVFFSKMRDASEEVTNPIVVSGFLLYPLPLQWSPPCLALSQLLVMLGRWADGALTPWELCLPISQPGPAHGADPSPILPLLPQRWTWLRSFFSPLVIQVNLAGCIYLWDACLFNLDEIGLDCQKGDEDWQAQHDYVLLVSLCKQDHTLCSLQFVATRCTGSKQTWHSDVPDHIRADLLAFSEVPIHCSLASLAGSRSGRAAAGGGSGTLPGTCLASPLHAPSRARRLFPLSSLCGSHSARVRE